MPLYVDRITGNEYLFHETLKPGYNVDASGDDYFFSASNITLVETMQGIGVVDFGDDGIFDYLTNGATMVGRDLALTAVRTGARKSIFNDISAEVAENTPDLSIVNGLYQYGAMDGATNLVTTVITSWSKTSAAFTTTNPSSNIYRIAHDGTLSGSVYNLFASASLNRVASCEARLVSGTLASTDILGFGGGGTSRGTTFDLSQITSEWTPIGASVTSAESTTLLEFKFNNTTAKTIEVRFVRAVNSTVAHPAFPDGSAAAATYGGDLLSFSGTYAGTGYAVIPFNPYEWSNTGNPADAQPVIFEAGALTVSLDASGFYTTNGGAVSTKKPVANTLSVIIVTWDGVNHTISVDDETPVSNASAIVPTTGTTYLGNTALGSKEAHAAIAALIQSGTITAGERTTWNSGLQSRLSGVTFR